MSKIHIDWDDNSQETVDLSGGTINLSHTYSIEDQYTITMSGRTTEISTMTLSGNSISGITGLDQTGLTITSLNLNYNDFTTLPLINNNLKKLYLDYSISGATSTVPNYSSSTLDTLHLRKNNLTTYTPSTLPNTMHEFIADDNTISTIGVTNIVSEMHNNLSSKTGMTISLVNNYYPLIDTTDKYDLIDYSGATVRTTGRFELEVIKNASYQETRAYQVTLQKLVTDHPINIHVDWDDGNINDYVFAATGTSMDLTKYYSSGTTGMTYYPKIDAYFDDITYLQVQRTHNFTTGATISVKEFPNIKTLNLPYYESPYYNCKWVGTIDLSRNNKLENLYIDSQGFTNIVYPNDVSHIKQITANNCPIHVSPRVDKMSSLINLYNSSCSLVGEMYSPSGNSNLVYFSLSYNSTLTAGPIPDFSNCTGLTQINISHTNRTSSGNTIWSTLTNLSILNAYYNNSLTGNIPNLSNCNKLTNINFGQCDFTSIGITDWNTLPALLTISLSLNYNLSITAPTLTNSTDLQYVYYNNSNFYGEFPDISNNTNLKELNLSSNNFNRWNKVLFSKSLSDGKILIGGYFWYYSGLTCENILKLNNDGTPDINFKRGFTNIKYKNIDTFDTQSDGSIIIGGNFTTYSGITANYIKGLTADGSLNSGFTNGDGFNNTVFTIKTQNDDKVLVGGAFTTYSGITTNYMTRLNNDGTQDSEFLTGVTFNGWIYAIAIQSDDKILVGGTFTSFLGLTSGRVLRLNTDGTKDTSFDVKSVNINGTIYDIDIQTDGKIIVVGDFTNGISVTSRIARFNTGGTFDTTFDTSYGFDKAVRSVKVLSDGKILCTGYFSTYSGTTVNGIARLNSDGTLDTTFNMGSGFNFYNKNNNLRAECLSIDTNNKIIVGGEFTSYSGTTASKLIRLNSGGTIDTTFVNGANVLTIDVTNNTGITDLRLEDCSITDYHNSLYGLSILSKLFMPNNNLSKYPVFSNLPLLKEIDLSTNGINGDIGDIFITNTALTYIKLIDNGITGNIPTYFSGLTNLSNLILSSNSMSGELPESVITNSALQYISIGLNNFTSGFTYLSGRTNLILLEISSNNFSGTTMFDMSAWNNSPLYSLQVQYCNLSGILTGWYTCSTYPNIINFSYNNFTGDIPPIINCTYATYLSINMNNNYFTGYTSMSQSTCYVNSYSAAYNYLPDAEINKLIADVRKTTKRNGTLNVSGTYMGKPTGQGLTDIAYLQTTMGWTVTYNV